MKLTLALVLFLAAGCSVEVSQESNSSGTAGSDIAEAASAVASQTVEAGCGMCTYHIDGVQGCELAVKVADQPYLVTGSDFDAMANGLCKGPKQVEIVGAVEGDKFAATSVKLIE